MRIQKILILFFFFASLPVFSEGIIWSKSILKSLDLAQKKNQPILVDLYADWCTLCKVLEAKIYPKPEVQAEVQTYITVRLNGEEFPNLMERYDAKGFPSILFLDPKGNLLEKIGGLPSSEMILETSKKAKEKLRKEKQILEEIQTKKNVPENAYKLGTYYYSINDLESAKKYFLLLKSQPNTDLQKDSASQAKKKYFQDGLYNLGLVYMDLEEFKNSEMVWKEYLQSYKSSATDLPSVYYFLGVSQKFLKQNKLAKKNLQTALKLSTNPEEKKRIQKEIQEL